MAGRFIASCTQEEIMQMCVPEFNVGMLHYGTLHVAWAHGASLLIVSDVR